MRYLMVTTAYNAKLAIPLADPATSGAVLAALSEARKFSVNGYGSDQTLVPEDGELELTFADGSKVPSADEVSRLKARLEAAEREKEKYSKYWTDERAKTKELTERLAQPAAA